MSESQGPTKGLIDAVTRQCEGKVEAAKKRYPKLLEESSTDPKHVAELREAMAVLGKGPVQLAEDHATLSEAHHLQALIVAGNLQAELDAAARAVFDHQSETHRIHHERAEGLRELSMAQGSIEGRMEQARSARVGFDALKAKHPDLLMHEFRPEPARQV